MMKGNESWLKTNHPDIVSKTCTASSPNNTQISEAQQAPISSTSPLMSCESSSTQSVSQSSPLLTASKSIQTPVSSNGVSRTPTIAGPSSSSQVWGAVCVKINFCEIFIFHG